RYVKGRRLWLVDSWLAMKDARRQGVVRPPWHYWSRLSAPRGTRPGPSLAECRPPLPTASRPRYGSGGSPGVRAEGAEKRAEQFLRSLERRAATPQDRLTDHSNEGGTQ